MKSPTMIYKHPGNHKIHGSTFDYKVVDADQVDSQLSAGWYRTTTEALEGVPKDDEAPTRSEIEAQAKSLDISFRSDISSAKLLKKIDEALAK